MRSHDIPGGDIIDANWFRWALLHGSNPYELCTLYSIVAVHVPHQHTTVFQRTTTPRDCTCKKSFILCSSK